MKNTFMKRFCIILAAIMLICYGSAAIILKLSNFSISQLINSGNDFSFNINKDFNFNNDFNKYNYDLNDEIDENSDGVDNIQLSFVSGDIIFHENNENKIKVTLSGSLRSSSELTAPKLQYSKNGSTIKVTIQKNSFFGSYSLNSKIDIYLPKDYSKNLSVSSVSADILLSDKKFVNLEAATTSGDIKLSNITVDSLNAKTVSGDMSGSNITSNKFIADAVSGKIDFDNFEGVTKASTISGNIAIKYTKLIGNIDAHSTSGDIRFGLPDNSSFNLDSSSTSGDINSRFSLDNTSSGKRTLSGSYGNGNNKLSIHTTSGDITLNKN
jgi:lia operon protein LiaG